MTSSIRGELGIADQRQFHLIDYRHGHTQALLRGVPEPDEDEFRREPSVLPEGAASCC
ncbi:hypothetical protein KOI35_33015 [Actinoplanes bogorensis]|uniref:Uncharacterized protein n=1 Tax=Paractinoplanes bogorensis TaxID=1610840 RepID=A0ABS5YY12_9ACTN|nr:hypothetical protein [Actinoplanes bogorensis]MBU2668345.1 hypothetical protein [Actinoplanes bogorensis]